MNPQTVFCPNLDCLARGQVGKGNIGIHSHKERRYLCHVCNQTFAATQGTVFYRLQTDQEVVTTVIALLAHGCPLPAIVAVFQLDERTVADWQKRAGHQCEQVHEHLVQQPRDLGQVQADEIRVKRHQAIVWWAMAIQVSTRLWLGATVGEHRNEALLAALMQQVRALPCVVLCCSVSMALSPIWVRFIRFSAKRFRRGNKVVRPCDPGTVS
jgi:transposase-like protein